MRNKLRLLCLGLFVIASPAVFATPLPVGNYSLTARTPTSGIHSGSDEGTVSGMLTFDAASNLTFADLTFDDTTSAKLFTFTVPGPTTINVPPGLLSATISNAVDPSQLFAFSIRIPSNPSGTFTMTCGTDCLNWMLVDDGGPNLTYVEVTGSIAPVPEPSEILLVGTGTLALAALRRRSWLSSRA
ncbi:MAG TPA: PEP-CTERM sorting domain-containing protein [Edaphobacter sp.]|nr:PEP-CTERM sorting domain-containing protein [Edaphobacter sp.]